MTAVVGFRVADWDTPLWVNPNRTPSRWWVPGMIVQYWSLHPLTPWAEYLRGMNVRDPAHAAEILLRPWAAQLELPDDAVELMFSNAQSFGIAPDALVDDDWTACQSWVAAQQPSAIVVPSAALAGTKNVILYGPRVRSRYGVAPLDPAVDVPCDAVAGLSIVLADLLTSVRWRSDPHAGLEAWRNGQPPPLPPLVKSSRI